MKTKTMLTALLIGLLVLMTPGSGKATSTQMAGDLNFQRAFLRSSNQLSDHPWWQSHTVVDPVSSRAHTAYFTDQSIFYATCGANCGSAANWTHTAVDPAGDYSSLSFPTLDLDSSGRPRMMWYDGAKYVYAECNDSCSQAAKWTKVRIALSPYYIGSYPANPRYFALTPQNQPRFIANYHEGLTYAYCSSNCLSASSWAYSDITFGPVDSITAPQLEITASGKLVVAGYNNWESELLYAECSQNCQAGQNWRFVKVADNVSDPTYAMRLDASGRPRIAYYKMSQADTQMYYAWANANFTTTASWTTDAMPLPSDINRTLDLAIDSQGNPHIVYVDDNSDLRYLRCTSMCNTPQSEWWRQYIETRSYLDTNHYVDPGGFDASAWTIDGYASLALDKNDSPLVSYYVRNELFSGITAYPNIWAVRFGRALNLKNQVYLPLTRK